MEEKTIEQLREEAFNALREAEKAMHAYAAALDVGAARTKAFSCLENIRLAWRNA